MNPMPTLRPLVPALLLGLLALPGAVADQGTTVDLEPETNGAFATPGETTQINLTVRNTGPAPATYQLTTSVLTIGWKAWFVPAEVSLGSLQQQTVSLRITAPSNATRADNAYAALYARNKALSSDEDKAELKVGIWVPAPRINVLPDGLNATARPDSDAAWSLRLRNDGKYAESVDLVLLPPETAWHAHQISSFRLAPSETRAVDAVLRIPAATRPGPYEATLVLRVPGANGTETPWRLSLTVTNGSLPSAGSDPPTFAPGGQRNYGAAIAASLAVPLLAALAWEGVRVRLALLAVGLFSRLDQTSVLDHERRARILQAVQSTPGIHFGDLRRLLELGNGTLAHHLRMLTHNGLVRTRHDGFRLRHYPAHGPIDAASFLTEAQRRITAIVGERPGIRLRDLSRELDLSRQVVNYHVQRLLRNGHLRADREGTRPRFFPATSSSAPG